MTIFDILNDIIKNKSKKLSNEPDFESVFNIYMINRWLSMDDRFIGLISKTEPYSSNYSLKAYYELLCDVIPQSSNTFIKYIKKGK